MPFKWRGGNIWSPLEKRPVLGGTDSDGSLIYVGRAMHEGMYIPCKIIPTRNYAAVSYAGEEIPVEAFEYLSGKMKHFQWITAGDGHVVEGAVSAGDDNGEELYIGRAAHDGSVTVGKIHPSHKCLYMPYGGQEIPFHFYEVLVYRKRGIFTSSADGSSSESD
ncbi:hypothetical protein PVAND_001686 [Polypedilum vanderplanki]|uniref:Farnesoic acid O-methyltransferase n=1 Tax=Polypedilum vanderplanki TaxID=319348 RepID=A0A9J6BNP5_POLVA|nr:hypothetical protein PVAND_001686 [Polypedilum vanderplanki]